MFRPLALTLLLMLDAGPTWAGGPRVAKPVVAEVAPPKACLDAIASAEAAHGVPTGFLLAIARVESGRLDARSGQMQPWPWTIDVGGKGAFFNTRAEAVDAVKARQSEGVQSIDIGCLQVNLQQHPTAFASVEEAFDPVSNAAYAARFLVDLHRETGDWTIASGLYHSRTEALAAPYRAAVASRYSGTSVAVIAASALAPAPARPVDVLATAWAATLNQPDASLRLWPKVPGKSVRIGDQAAVPQAAPHWRLSSR